MIIYLLIFRLFAYLFCLFIDLLFYWFIDLLVYLFIYLFIIYAFIIIYLFIQYIFIPCGLHRNQCKYNKNKGANNEKSLWTTR